MTNSFILKILTSLFICSVLSGCSTLVANYIGEAESYKLRPEHLAEMEARYGYNKHQYCDDITTTCISYFKAEADNNSEHLVEDHEVDFGRGEELIRLNLERSNLPKLSGTMVILHGFRGSKEWMSVSGGYFRFLGFDVLMPDLLGHGDSEGDISFGAEDAEIFLRWLSSEIPDDEPVYILANSMGAVAAVNMVASLPNVQGLILQAPMRRFDEAVANYATSRGPWYTQIIPENSFKTGAQKALAVKGLNVSDTDIETKLKHLDIPVLVLASDIDEIAPYSHFTQWRLSQLSVHKVEGRSHPAMALIDQKEHTVILNFLTSGVP